jgi:hypothetical protein
MWTQLFDTNFICSPGVQKCVYLSLGYEKTARSLALLWNHQMAAVRQSKQTLNLCMTAMMVGL